jgi:enamine deaminase RidA (YjgF/YER057c/UK114 family)
MKNSMKNKGLIITLAIIGIVAATGSTWRGSQTERRHIKLSTTSPQAPFSDGVLIGKTLYLSGRIGYDPKTQKVPEDPKEEVRLALDGIKATLAEAGMTMDHLVSVQVFSPDPDRHYALFNEIYRTYFKGPLPARAFIGSGPILRGGRFEVQGIAVKD